MPSGGPRQPAPHTNHPNRADMTQAPAAPTGQTYGQAGQQMAAQQAVPVAGSPGLPQRPGTGSAPPAGLGPGEIPSLSDASARPREPITAGLPSGAGPGPEALNMATPGPEELAMLKGVFMRRPSEDLRRLIEWAETNL